MFLKKGGHPYGTCIDRCGACLWGVWGLHAGPVGPARGLRMAARVRSLENSCNCKTN